MVWGPAKRRRPNESASTTSGAARWADQGTVGPADQRI